MEFVKEVFDFIGKHGTSAAFVAVALFFFGRTIEIFWRLFDSRVVKRRVVIGLYSEISANLKTIEDFLGGNPDAQDVRKLVIEKKEFRPLLTVDETTKFYDSVTALLPHIKSNCLISLSAFYNQVQKITKLGAAFESSAFPTVSTTGRVGAVDDLWKAYRVAEKVGWKACHELEMAYPRRWFRDFKSG